MRLEPSGFGTAVVAGDEGSAGPEAEDAVAEGPDAHWRCKMRFFVAHCTSTFARVSDRN